MTEYLLTEGERREALEKVQWLFRLADDNPDVDVIFDDSDGRFDWIPHEAEWGPEPHVMMFTTSPASLPAQVRRRARRATTKEHGRATDAR